MITRRQANIGLLSAASAAVTQTGTASETRVMQLPPARTTGGKPLFEALKLRRSTREYSNRPLEAQVLSDLLWSAYGTLFDRNLSLHWEGPRRPSSAPPRPLAALADRYIAFGKSRSGSPIIRASYCVSAGEESGCGEQQFVTCGPTGDCRDHLL